MTTASSSECRISEELQDDAGRAAEADLVARIAARDQFAFEELVRTHGGAMLACARRFLRSEEDCADAVQDAFLSAFRSLPEFQGHARLGTWLHRIVVNHCLMRLRSQKRKPTVSIEALLPSFDETGHHVRPVVPWADVKMMADEARVRVRACIDRLPETYRTIILVRDIEGYDTPQAAALLGISIALVKTRLHRARQALRTLLEPYFATTESAATI
jgi:RNA polymerase sigma-70 factor (ECF subfamily)